MIISLQCSEKLEDDPGERRKLGIEGGSEEEEEEGEEERRRRQQQEQEKQVRTSEKLGGGGGVMDGSAIVHVRSYPGCD